MVELVVTLVLIGILGVMVAPVFFSVSPFTLSAGRTDFISIARFAQQNALARGPGVRVQLVLDHGAGQLRVETGPPPASCARTDATRSAGSITVLRSIDMDADLAYPLGPLGVVQFDPLGALQSGPPVSCPASVSADLNGDSVVDACIEPSGYAHENACF